MMATQMKETRMTTDHPWTNIAPGLARRVDADHVADFYWSVTHDGEPQLLLDAPTVNPTPRLPKLHGLVVRVVALGDGRSRLSLRLVDNSLRDIFSRLCRDLVDASRVAADEQAAAQIAVRRTWRWHHLLRGGGTGLLSPEEQKGLIGEIHVLRHLIQLVGAAAAVTSWRGPLGAPKDFEVGPHAIEAKARRGAATPHVRISSEDQLDGAGVDLLLLHVIDLSTAVDGSGATLNDSARGLFDAVRHLDEALLEPLEDRFAAAGFFWSDDYSEFSWSEGQHRLYRVSDGFPRLQASAVPTGVSRVRYAIDLNAIDQYQIPWTDADRLLTGMDDAT
jgi:hypothetical protein